MLHLVGPLSWNEVGLEAPSRARSSEDLAVPPSIWND